MEQEARLIELVIAYQHGQLDAFERLYEMLAGEVSRYFARRHAARFEHLTRVIEPDDEFIGTPAPGITPVELLDTTPRSSFYRAV